MKLALRLIALVTIALTTLVVTAPVSPAATPPLLPFDGTGDVLVIDDGVGGIVRITPKGEASVFVSRAEILAVKPAEGLSFSDNGIAVAADGTVYFTAGIGTDSDLYKRTPAGVLSLLATNSSVVAITDPTSEFGADLENLALDASGTIYLIDDNANAMVKVDPSTGAVSPFLDEATLLATLPVDSFVDLDANLVIDESGNVYFTNSGTPSLVWKATSAGAVSILADKPNEVQSVSSDATGGTFTLTLDSETTTAIAHDATAAVVQAALAALPSVGSSSVIVTGAGTAADPWYVEFVGAKAASDVSPMTSTSTDLTGGSSTAPSISTRVNGGAFDDLDSYLTRAPDGSLTVIDSDDDWIYRITTSGQISSLLRERKTEAVNGGNDVNLDSGIAYDDFGRLVIFEESSNSLLRFDSLLNGSVLATSAQIQAGTGTAPQFEGAAAFLPGPVPLLSSTPASGPDGTTITVNGTDCDLANAYAIFSFDPNNPSTATVAADGTWSLTRSHPAGTAPGDYSIVGGCGSNSGTNRYSQVRSFTLNAPPPAVVPQKDTDGYRLVATDGGVFTFGNRNFHGSLGSTKLNKPVVGGATDVSTFDGYWLVASDGGVFAFNTGFYGSAVGDIGSSSAVEIEPTPTGKGYWIVLANGRVLAYGDATSFGDASGIELTKPIVGMATTSTGKGYWLIAGDGGVFRFGDAGFFGSTGGVPLSAPVIDLAPTPDDRGYYIVAKDGGVFTFGNAVFRGSTGGIVLNAPVVSVLVTAAGGGYWLGAADGGVFTFGEAAPFLGSMGGIALNGPMKDFIF